MENYHQNMDDPYQQIGASEQNRVYSPKFDRETGRPISYTGSEYRPGLPEQNREIRSRPPEQNREIRSRPPKHNNKFRSRSSESRQSWWSFIIIEIIFSNIGLWLALMMCFFPVPISPTGSSTGVPTSIPGHDPFNLAMIAVTAYGILSNSLRGIRNRQTDQLPNRKTGSRSPGKVMNVLFGIAVAVAIWAYWSIWWNWFLALQNYDFVIQNNSFLTLLVNFTMLALTMTVSLLLIATRIKYRSNSQGAWYKIVVWSLFALVVVSCLQFLCLFIAGLSGALMPYAGNPAGDFINIICWFIACIGLLIQAWIYTRTRYVSGN